MEALHNMIHRVSFTDPEIDFDQDCSSDARGGSTNLNDQVISMVQ